MQLGWEMGHSHLPVQESPKEKKECLQPNTTPATVVNMLRSRSA